MSAEGQKAVALELKRIYLAHVVGAPSGSRVLLLQKKAAQKPATITFIEIHSEGLMAEARFHIAAKTLSVIKDLEISYYQCLFLLAIMLPATAAAHTTCLPPIPPGSPGTGKVAGRPATVNGINGLVFWAYDGLFAGFDCFENNRQWYPQADHETDSLQTPQHKAIDLAYAANATLTWMNVQVPRQGLYDIKIRYGFAQGFFKGVLDRYEQILVNGVPLIQTMHFRATGGFGYFCHSTVTLPLNAGTNVIQINNNGRHEGVARVDAMYILPPSGPQTPSNGGPFSPSKVECTQAY